eukprot:COSAG05_NODE_1342_length_5140_cov_2.897838_1_plen_68_part_00
MLEQVVFYCVPIGNVTDALKQLTGDSGYIIEYGADLRDNWEGVRLLPLIFCMLRHRVGNSSVYGVCR